MLLNETENCMKIMAIDYGDVRTGIAFSDIRGILASAYATVKESYAPKLVIKLVEIIEKEKPERIVIGLPKNMDGSSGYRCDECKELARLLGEKTDIPIDFEDERLTTVIAHDILSQNDIRGKKRKNTVDAVSATVILQSYLDKLK